MTLPTVTPTHTAQSVAQVVIIQTETSIPTSTLTSTPLPPLTETNIPASDTPELDITAEVTPETEQTEAVSETSVVISGAPTFSVLQSQRVASAGVIYYIASRQPIPVYACPSESCEMVWLLAPGGQVNVVQTLGLWHFIVLANDVQGFILASSVTSIAPTRLPTRTPTQGIVPLDLQFDTPAPFIAPPYYGGADVEGGMETPATIPPRTPWRRPPTQTTTPTRTPSLTRTPTLTRTPGGAMPTGVRTSTSIPPGITPPVGTITRTAQPTPIGGTPPPNTPATATFTLTATTIATLPPAATLTPSPTYTPTATWTWTLIPPTATPTWTPTSTPTWTTAPPTETPTTGS